MLRCLVKNRFATMLKPIFGVVQAGLNSTLCVFSGSTSTQGVNSELPYSSFVSCPLANPTAAITTQEAALQGANPRHISFSMVLY